MLRAARAGAPRCRTAGADFALLALGVGFACAVAAKDAEVPVVVATPKPVVMQPSAGVIPSPAVAPASPSANTGAGAKTVQSAAKPGKTTHAAKPGKAAAKKAKKSGKPAAKAKPKAKKR